MVPAKKVAEDDASGFQHTSVFFFLYANRMPAQSTTFCQAISIEKKVLSISHLR
jgi:hypothetical protein